MTVRAPATSANLGPGFDSLGLALGLYDEVSVTVTDGDALLVDVVGEGAASVPRDETHLVVRAMQEAFDRLGMRRPGMSLRCVNSIPHGRGLGSSAAAIVAGVLAASALAGAASDNEWMLSLASEIEGHPDNVAACILGGLTIAWTDGSSAHATRVEPLPALAGVIFVPAVQLSTATARGLLPSVVPHADAAHSAGRAALLVAAMTHRPELLVPATEDRLHQNYRTPAMPQTAALIGRLRAEGHAAVVSGAGPSILVLAPSSDVRPSELAVLAGRDWEVRLVTVGSPGAHVASSGDTAAAAPSG